MKLQEQVCTKEQAVRLKELGVEQQSLFYHYQQFLNGVESFEIYAAAEYDYGAWSINESVERALNGESKNQVYAAFTVAELMTSLPDSKWAVPYRYEKIDPQSDVFTEAKIVITKFSFGYEVAIHSIDDMGLKYFRRFDLAPVLADMLIYLLENGLISIDDVNQRLTTQFPNN